MVRTTKRLCWLREFKACCFFACSHKSPPFTSGKRCLRKLRMLHSLWRKYLILLNFWSKKKRRVLLSFLYGFISCLCFYKVHWQLTARGFPSPTCLPESWLPTPCRLLSGRHTLAIYCGYGSQCLMCLLFLGVTCNDSAKAQQLPIILLNPKSLWA